MLLHAAKRYRSIVLEADGKHLLTDVSTGVGVAGGLMLVVWTGKVWLDPVMALLVAANIVWTGIDLMRRSFNGLMDHALPDAEQEQVRLAIRAHLGPNMDYHALRTRQAGSRRFVDFHLLVPGRSTVHEAHALAESIEAAVQAALPGVEVAVHIEPIEERQAWEDSALLPLEQQERLKRGEEPMRGAP
jgi:cation diffusion facilitator family transporter